MNIVSSVFPWCKTEIYVGEPANFLHGCLTLVIGSGSARLQTYATPAELRKLAHELTMAVDAYEQAENKHEQA